MALITEHSANLCETDALICMCLTAIEVHCPSQLRLDHSIDTNITCTMQCKTCGQRHSKGGGENLGKGNDRELQSV